MTNLFCSVDVKNTLFKRYFSMALHFDGIVEKETYKKCVVAYNDIIIWITNLSI